jgi:hypothetical protein
MSSSSSVRQVSHEHHACHKALLTIVVVKGISKSFELLLLGLVLRNAERKEQLGRVPVPT